jgi:predicted RNA-binding protein associated with RNAse of E/G family
MLQRPGDAYAVWVFWEGPGRAFSRWYVNLQDPFRRTSVGFDTLDHELDLWSPDGRTWHRKDDDHLDQRVAEGLFTPAEAAAIRSEADRLLAKLRTDGGWWDEGWAAWEPDDAWPQPTLPPGWERA